MILLPFALISLTKLESKKGHWYPVTLEHLKYRVRNGEPRLVGSEMAAFLLYTVFLYSIASSSNINVMVEIVVYLLILIFFSIISPGFILVHKKYRKARKTTISAILIVLFIFSLSRYELIGNTMTFIWLLVSSVFWSYRIMVFKAMHWYRNKIE